LDDLVAFGDDRQRRKRIGSEEHLVVGIGFQVHAIAAGDGVQHFGFVDPPVHAGFTLPDFNRLLRGELIAQTMPRRTALT
jgi:hypothetical protein